MESSGAVAESDQKKELWAPLGLVLCACSVSVRGAVRSETVKEKCQKAISVVSPFGSPVGIGSRGLACFYSIKKDWNS